MSLLTLRSTNNNNGSNISESAANFSNHFKEGIEISPGDTFELVSMSINKLDKFEIIQGSNDTFVWRIGPGPSSSSAPANFSQHVVTLTAGSYNGADLAKHIAEVVNNSTLLGVYHGGWTCTYTPPSTTAGTTTNAKFTLTYNEVATPTSNGTSLTLRQHYGGGSPYSITNDATNVTKKIQMTQDDDLVGNRAVSKNATTPVPPNNIGGYAFAGDRSIFGNGGEYHATFKAVEGLKAIADLSAVRFKNWNNGGVATDFVDASWSALSPGATNLRNGWAYEVTIDTGAAGAIKTFNLTGHGGIATVNNFTGGSGYNIGDTGNLVGPTGTSGGSYEVSAVTAGAPTAIDIVTEGIGYTVGDELTLQGSGDGLAKCDVATANVSDGTGYALANDVITTPNLTGSGCKVNITGVTGGAITAITIAHEGSGYTVGETLIINGGNNNATFKVASVGPAGEIYYGAFDYTGRLGLTQDTAATSFTNGPTDDWSYYFKMTNGGGGAQTRFQSDLTTGGSYFIQMEKADGSPLSVTYYKFFANASMGLCRDQLYTGFTTNPGNYHAVYTNDKNGMDFQIQCSSQDITSQAGTSPFVFSVFQMKGTAGPVSYPNAGWRTFNTVINNAKPTAWTAGNPQNPTNWTSFTEETDQVRFTIKVNGIRNFVFSCSHDTNGDNTFIEEVEFLKTGQAKGGDVLIDLNSLTREIYYPLHPICILSRGLPFEPMSAQMGGIFDTKTITQDGKDIRFTNASGSADPHDYETGIDTVSLASSAATPLTLSAMFKFGLITGSQVFNGNFTGAGPNQITAQDLTPNIANIANTLGFENGYSFQGGQATNPVETDDDRAPFTDIVTPSLHVELPDFNIKSYSGESSDTGRAVAVIPKEQWTTDSALGTLHYIAPYPIPIKLNVATKKPYYQINARIRQPDGKLADDLINPSQITLKLDRSAEAKQEDALRGALRAFQSINANRQDQQISTIGSNNPLL